MLARAATGDADPALVGLPELMSAPNTFALGWSFVVGVVGAGPLAAVVDVGPSGRVVAGTVVAGPRTVVEVTGGSVVVTEGADEVVVTPPSVVVVVVDTTCDWVVLVSSAVVVVVFVVVVGSGVVVVDVSGTDVVVAGTDVVVSGADVVVESGIDVVGTDVVVESGIELDVVVVSRAVDGVVVVGPVAMVVLLVVASGPVVDVVVSAAVVDVGSALVVDVVSATVVDVDEVDDVVVSGAVVLVVDVVVVGGGVAARRTRAPIQERCSVVPSHWCAAWTHESSSPTTTSTLAMGVPLGGCTKPIQCVDWLPQPNRSVLISPPPQVVSSMGLVDVGTMPSKSTESSAPMNFT